MMEWSQYFQKSKRISRAVMGDVRPGRQAVSWKARGALCACSETRAWWWRDLYDERQKQE